MGKLSKNPILLIDTDVFLWRCVFRNSTEWGNDGVEWHTESALKELQVVIDSLVSLTHASTYIPVVGGEPNFRYELFKDYKSNRPPKPAGITEAYDMLKSGFLSEELFSLPRLETDDTLGILHTEEYLDKSIIVSTDKDMKTIPGYHIKPFVSDISVTHVTPKQAEEWHMYQTLLGDSTDGIKGCPRVGKVGAEKILAKDPTWRAVLKRYEKAYPKRSEAMEQMKLNARLTFILRKGFYNRSTNKIKLWDMV